ncbi:MAG: DNA methyltransferase, partial [Myxococcota bacterium]
MSDSSPLSTLAELALVLGRALLHEGQAEVACTGTTPDWAQALQRLMYTVAVVALAEHRGLLPDPQGSAQARERYATSWALKRLEEQHPTDGAGARLWGLVAALEEGSEDYAVPRLGSGIWSGVAVELEALAQVPDAQVARCVGAVRGALEADGWTFGWLGESHARWLEQRLVVRTGGTLVWVSAPGRKITGSYYSPSVVVESLLDTALEPVLDEAMAATDPEAALLALTICDPACGTGRFLVAASHRVAQRLVRVREQRGASPKEVAGAYREVVLRCVYGVDLHPWTVELCRVALWLEVSEPGWSPSTLGRHVRCGNGLLGATPALMAEGVPDRAFIREDGTSDEKATALQVRRRNRAGRRLGSGDRSRDRAGAVRA